MGSSKIHTANCCSGEAFGGWLEEGSQYGCAACVGVASLGSAVPCVGAGFGPAVHVAAGSRRRIRPRQYTANTASEPSVTTAAAAMPIHAMTGSFCADFCPVFRNSLLGKKQYCRLHVGANCTPKWVRAFWTYRVHAVLCVDGTYLERYLEYIFRDPFY